MNKSLKDIGFLLFLVCLYPMPVYAHTPYQSVIVLEGILFIPILLGLYFIGSNRRVLYFVIGMVSIIISNYLIFQEISALVFWISISLPYLLLVYSIVVFIQKRKVKA
jgi:hypothetical protein